MRSAVVALGTIGLPLAVQTEWVETVGLGWNVLADTTAQLTIGVAARGRPKPMPRRTVTTARRLRPH